MTNWGGLLPPVDVGGWADFQRKRLKQEAEQRIAQAGAVTGGWAAEAQRRIQDLTGGIGAGIDAASAALPGGAQWDAELERIRQEAQASEAQYPPPREALGDGLDPGAFVNETGTPQGEAITSQLAETATRETPGGQFMTGVARAATGDVAPMTADTPVQNVLGMGQLALQNVGAPLPMRGPLARLGQAIPGSVAIDTAARMAAEALPGGQTSVLEGAEIPNYVPFLGGQTLTKDTPVLGGLTTPDVAGPLAAGVLAGEPDDILRLTGGAVGLADEAGGRLLQGAEDLAGVYGRAGIDPTLGFGRRRPDPVALGRRGVRPPTGPERPGGPMSSERLAQRVRDAEEAIYTWQAGETAETDHVARLIRTGREGATLGPSGTDWDALFGAGRVDPDALNRALVAYREEGLSEVDALTRAIGTPEERAANLQAGAAAGGVRDPSGLTKGLLQKAIADLAGAPDPTTGAVRPFVTTSERGAFKAGRNAPPSPDAKKNAWEYVDKKGQSWWLSTPYEVLFAKQLDENPNVAYWAQSSPEAVMETTVRHGGEPKVFTPDFIVVGTDGRIQVVEIKNYGSFRQVPWRVPEKLREAEEFFNSKGVGFSIFVEDQLGRQAMGRITPDDLLPDANGRMGVVNGFFVENEEGAKRGRFDPEAARQELVSRLHSASRSWDTNELGYLSGRHPLTPEEYDEVLSGTHWPEWTGRRERGSSGRPARITADQRDKIIKAGPRGVDPAEGGFGRAYEGAYPLPPEQGGYRPEWTPHQAFAEFNERQRRKGAPTIAVDAVEAYPRMRQRTADIHREWGKQVADGQHGLTVDPVSGEVGVPGRYAVSIAPGMEMEIKGTPDQIHPDRLAMWMAEMEPILREIPQARVGFWYDSSKDRTYLDLSIGLNSLRQAEDLGKRMSQYSIFDSVTKKDIDLRYPGLPAGQRPAPPSVQEQRDALVRFGRGRVRQQPGGRGVPGASPVAVPGGPPGAAGAAVRAGAGDIPGGVPGAEAAGPAGAAGPVGPGLGGVEPGGVGPDGGAPFGAYPPPVPYAGSAVDGAAGAAPGPGGRGAAGEPGAPGAPAGLTDRSDLAQAGGQGALGGAAGFAYTPSEDEDEELTLEERLQMGGTGLVAGTVTSGRGRGLLRRAGRDAIDIARGRADLGGATKLGGATQLAQALPLASLASLSWNAIGGVARTGQRYLTDSLGNLDRPGESLADLIGMGAGLPAAIRAAGQEFGKVSERGARSQGLAAGGLTASQNFWAQLLTSGTRANTATDMFFRTLNEGGARARIAARSGGDVRGGVPGGEGIDPLDEDVLRGAQNKAGDFATFVGKNSPVADALVEAGKWANDRTANPYKRLFGATVAGFAPYVRTPERILSATAQLATDPATQSVAFIRALRRGDEAAMREAGGRFALAAPLTAWFAASYLDGSLRGDPPANPTERRKQEAQGARWNTFHGVPVSRMGPVGGAASAVATAMAAGERAILRGEHPADLGRDVVGAMGRWALSNSYLEDLQNFSEDVASGRLAQAVEKQAVNVGTRPLSPLTSAIGAFDETERSREGTGEELLYKLPGGRYALPERIDPATGGSVRRKGTPGERYFLGSQGTEVSPEGEALNRFGIKAPDYRAGEEYKGGRLTGDQARRLSRASGSEVNREVRQTLASPEYARADDEGKASLLRAAMTKARAEADIAAGEDLPRDQESQAKREWQAVPKYRGVDGTPDEIRRLNARIARAKSALAAAARKGRDERAEWIDAHPDEYELTRYGEMPAARLKQEREAIEDKYPGIDLGG